MFLSGLDAGFGFEFLYNQGTSSRFYRRGLHEGGTDGRAGEPARSLGG